MKQLSFIFLFPFFLLFSTNEKNILQTETTSQVNQPCKLKKVFYNDILSQEYHYNNENQLILINGFSNGKLNWFFSLNYDELDRISLSEYGLYFYYSNEYAEENEIETNPIISQLNRYTYQYDETNNSQINIIKIYFGRASQTKSVEKNLKYTDRFSCSYNSKSQLVKVENIHKKKRKKKVKKKKWWELEYEEGNVARIKNYFIFENKDTILYSTVAKEYDSNLNLQFNIVDFMNFPMPIPQNNLTYFKRISQHLESYRISKEYNFIHEYDKNGLLIKSFKNTIHPSEDIYDGVFTYKYACE